MAGAIFISYRRSDAKHAAGRVHGGERQTRRIRRWSRDTPIHRWRLFVLANESRGSLTGPDQSRSGAFEGDTCDAFVKDLPLDRVAVDVLIAYEMNGAPLRPENGFPARLVVPGFYGTNSVKWLTRLTLAETLASGPLTTRWYNDPIWDASGQPTGATSPVWSIAPESVIVSPAPDQTLAIGKAVEVWGWAWVDGGVDTVDVGADHASGWTPAAVEPRTGRTWQRFTARWHPERRGKQELSSLARCVDGRSQPSAGARNAIHRVAVEVV